MTNLLVGGRPTFGSKTELPAIFVRGEGGKSRIAPSRIASSARWVDFPVPIGMLGK